MQKKKRSFIHVEKGSSIRHIGDVTSWCPRAYTADFGKCIARVAVTPIKAGAGLFNS